MTTLPQTNKQAILDLIDAANRGDLDRVAAAYAGEYRDHTLGGSRGIGDKEATLEAFAALRQAFPDTHHVVDDLIAEGDRVVLRLHAHGSHQGPYSGIEGTGRTVHMQTTAIYRLEKGLIVERWCDGTTAVAEHLQEMDDLRPGSKVQILRGVEQPWTRDAAGGRFQEIGLPNVSLTHFEVDAGAAFELHAHRSEQITFVVEGELTFQLENEEHVLRPGDAIAVPSGVPHRVVAGSSTVVAFDAWSPPQSHLGT